MALPHGLIPAVRNSLFNRKHSHTHLPIETRIAHCFIATFASQRNN